MLLDEVASTVGPPDETCNALPPEASVAVLAAPPLELVASAALNSLGGHLLDDGEFEEVRA